MFKKILSINSDLVSAGRKDFSLNPSAQSTLGLVRQSLESNKPVEDEVSMNIIATMCTQWDYADRLAALDLLRCTATSPLAAKYSTPSLGSIVQIAISGTLEGIPSGSQPNENYAMMTLRAIANLFTSPDGRKLLAQPIEATRVVEFIERVAGLSGTEPIGKYNRNLLVALGTVAINYAVLASKQSGSVPNELQVRLVKVLELVLRNQKDGEVAFRALVAAGTFVIGLGKTEVGAPLRSAVELAKDGVADLRVKAVADECLAIL
jgi:phospholipase A-2-activating protein